MLPTYNEEIAFAKEILPSSITGIELLAPGKRGIVLKGVLDGAEVAIKVKRQDSEARSAIEFETNNLAKVNGWGIGPKVLLVDDAFRYVVMELVNGRLIGEFLHDEQTTDEQKKTVLGNAMKQCEVLDAHGLNKFEMTNPYKHIIVKEDLSVVFIDFERARFSDRPKNVSQFNEYRKRILKE